MNPHFGLLKWVCQAIDLLDKYKKFLGWKIPWFFLIIIRNYFPLKKIVSDKRGFFQESMRNFFFERVKFFFLGKYKRLLFW